MTLPAFADHNLSPEAADQLVQMNQEATRSTHRVEVVPVRLEKHPNADRLSVVQVYGYTVCTGSQEWLDHQQATFDEILGPDSFYLGAYIPPDSLVPVDRPEFDFLKDQARDGVYARIKAKKLRGVVSYGLLVPAPPGSALGDDVAELLGVKHYEPPLEEDRKASNFAVGGEVASGPNLYTVKYDVDAFRRYHQVFKVGEKVLVTEKIDGSNGRFVFHDDKMYCGSRTEWKKEFPTHDHVTVERLVAQGVEEERARSIVERLGHKPPKKNLWWYALDQTPSLRAFCEANPGVVVYGEVFGRQGRLKYTDDPNEVFFAAFDLMRDGRWVDTEEARFMLIQAGVPVVPLLYRAWYDFDTVCALAEGSSHWPGARCIREGVVVSPLHERYDSEIGRVKLKVVSATYLERQN